MGVNAAERLDACAAVDSLQQEVAHNTAKITDLQNKCKVKKPADKAKIEGEIQVLRDKTTQLQQEMAQLLSVLEQW